MSKALITGGAGFIGSNLAHRLLSRGHDVTIFDNLSRSGTDHNISWLREQFGQDQFRLVAAGLADFGTLKNASEGADCIYHLAGQVAVTASVQDPRADFEDNARGTFNALEAARLSGHDPIFIYASTNKVYGGMESVKIVRDGNHYTYGDLEKGIPESMPIDFHSPYGCSKGAGDQYTRDYYRIYGLRTVVMRQSCIYGYRQFGIEDQGWVAWFIIASLKNCPITICGDGKQTRDILFIDDLLDAYDAAVNRIDVAAGQIYNVGGGPDNTIAIWSEFGPLLGELLGRPVEVTYDDWRPGDQQVFVSDIRKIRRDLGWAPKINTREGIRCLYEWIQNNQDLFAHL